MITTTNSCDQTSCGGDACSAAATAAASKLEKDGTTPDGGGSSLCLAVVRENGVDVVIFDAAGVPRTFLHSSSRSNGKSSTTTKQLCFHSHTSAAGGGGDGDGFDDLLTPCFDQDGRHGTPDEPCFCGIDTPHLHAHVRDPKLCGSGSNSCSSDIGYLASQVLYPAAAAEDDDAERSELIPKNAGAGGTSIPMIHLAVSDSLPKACNFNETMRALQRDATKQHSLSFSSDVFYRPGSQRRHQVQHGNHVDYLVHNARTGRLHLEHDCGDCGERDVHGTFNAVGQRKLAVRQQQKQPQELHFFQVAHHDQQRPFNLLDCFADLFEVNSDRVAAATTVVMDTHNNSSSNKAPATTTGGQQDSQKKHAHSHAHTHAHAHSHAHSHAHAHTHAHAHHTHHQGPKVTTTSSAATASSTTSSAKKKNIVRSTLNCKNICCASEIPIINATLEPIDGVEKIMVNAPLRQVLVDHDASIVTAVDLAEALNAAKLGASVLRDGGGGRASAAPNHQEQQQQEGRSQFFVTNICCASEIPAIRSILEPMTGVTNISINTTAKTVYVDHDFGIVSAKAMCDALNAQRFGAHVKLDAAALTTAASGASQSAFVTSTLAIVPSSSQAAAAAAAGTMDTKTLTLVLQSFVDSSQLETFVVDMPTKTISVVHNPFCVTAETIADLVSEQTPQLDATVSMDGADPVLWKFPETLVREATDDSKIEGMETEGFTYPRPTVIVSGLLWVVSMLSLIGGNWEHLKWVALVSVAFGIPPIAMKAFSTLRRYQFDTNCLMLFASVGAIALQDFTEAAAVVFLFALSEWLEVRATTRARHALAHIINLRPEKANLVHPFTQELMLVPAASVPVGALVSIMAGEKIPCDGAVVEGHSTVDESSLTGESRPIRKGPNDKVSGGTVNSGMSPLMVRTTATADNSAVSRLIRLVEEAQANRSDTEKIVDRFAQLYTPVVVLAALLMCSIPWAFGKEHGREWTNNGLILIVVACPCALIISTPISYVAGLAAAAQQGVLVKGGANLEALSAIKSICMDKTGTATNGIFALLHMKVVTKNLSRIKVFQYLSLMEERASHPVAHAILAAANNEKIVLPKKMELQKHKIINGEGVSGVIDGLEVFVGNERLFERLGLLEGVDAEQRKEVEDWKSLGGTIGYMSIEGHGIVCSYCAADGIRSESAAVVRSLKNLGINITMLTGDNKDAADAIGKQIGLLPDEIKSKLLPEEKLQFVEGLSEGTSTSVICNPLAKRQLVMMIGDGVNDAPALAAADVGVAMGEGAALSMETSDVTLLDSNLEKIEYSIRLGRRVTAKIIQNVVFSLVVKFVVLGFALAGMTELWAAIATDVGAMLLVTLNAMLLLPKRQSETAMEGMKGDIEEADTRKTRQALVREGLGRTEKASSEIAIAKNVADDVAFGKKECTKGCCGSDSAKSVPVPNKNNACSKEGCCDSAKTEKTGDAEGCCGSDSAKSIPVEKKKDSCSKGCCESESSARLQKNNTSSACAARCVPKHEHSDLYLHGHSHVHTEQKEPCASNAHSHSHGHANRTEEEEETSHGYSENANLGCNLDHPDSSHHGHFHQHQDN